MSTDKPKTHWRKVFKSDHLGVTDLETLTAEGHSLIFTVAYVRQECGVRVAGSKGDYNIAYFKDKDSQGKPIKPWVLNAGNSKLMKGFCGGSAYLEDWKQNVLIQLFIDPSVKFGGEITGGVRLSPIQPKVQKKQLNPSDKGWDNAIVSFINHGDLKVVLEHVDISVENQEKIIEEAQNRMDAKADD